MKGIVVRILVGVILSLSWTFAQSGEKGIPAKTVYFLRDDAHKKWCGYASESRFKTQKQALAPLVLGGADYMDTHISTVHVTESDETGDWEVYDEYATDKSGKLERLKRTINVFPENNREEQLFLIQNEKAIKQHSTYHAIDIGKTPQKSVEWFKAPPVFASIEAFPFSPLIGSKRIEVWTNGDACIPIRRR